MSGEQGKVKPAPSSGPEGATAASSAPEVPDGLRPSSFQVLVLSGTKALAAKRQVSLRTLHRKLADKGVETRAVREEERRRVLTDLLKGGAPLIEVARQIGLSSTDALGRVVRKLFGVPPGRLRDRLRSARDPDRDSAPRRA